LLRRQNTIDNYRCRRQNNRNRSALDPKASLSLARLSPMAAHQPPSELGSNSRHSHPLFPAICNVQPSHCVSKQHPASQVHLTCISCAQNREFHPSWPDQRQIERVSIVKTQRSAEDHQRILPFRNMPAFAWRS
jgi:hypothetical protein